MCSETIAQEIKVAKGKNSPNSELIELYERRSESAIGETARQYGTYCLSIAMNILRNREDAEECVQDAYLNAWNSIPPQRPEVFSAFIGRITRNLSLNKYKAFNAKKRGGNEVALALSELESCIPTAQNVEVDVENSDLVQIVKDYLSTIRKEDKIFFILRYWYNDSVAEIAEQFNCGIGKINMSLHRTRKKLKTYLERRGITHEN
jgi:RNA polymerase sigma-70 factor (ECF subfamily)